MPAERAYFGYQTASGHVETFRRVVRIQLTAVRQAAAAACKHTSGTRHLRCDENGQAAARLECNVELSCNDDGNTA